MRADASTLAADDERQRPAQVDLADRQWCSLVGADDAKTVTMEVDERSREILDRDQPQVLGRPRRGLDRGRAERGCAAGREEHAVDAGRLRRAQERAHVLGILEVVEDEHERRFGCGAGRGEHVVQRGPDAGCHDEGDALMTVEPAERRERPALHLDDRDPQGRGMQHQLVERGSPLGDDEQSMGRTTGREGFLDRASTRDDLLVLGELEPRWRGRPLAIGSVV